MKMNEMNLNELEQVSGGNIFDDIKDLLKKIPNPFGAKPIETEASVVQDDILIP